MGAKEMAALAANNSSFNAGRYINCHLSLNAKFNRGLIQLACCVLALIALAPDDKRRSSAAAALNTRRAARIREACTHRP